MTEVKPSRARRLVRVGVLGLVGLLVLSGGYWAWKRSQPKQLPPLETKLPEFVEPDAKLPRAPASSAFGIAIGATQLEPLQRELERRGIACDDTSVRAGIQRMREQKSAELAAADDPDAVTGASIVWRRSKKERNPQVRLSCSDTRLDQLDGARPPGPAGRALFIFDSPEHPLRHASLRRNHGSRERAIADLRETVAHYQAIYGEPTSRRGELPESGAPVPERVAPVSVEWKYADLLVGVSLNDFGKSCSVDEKLEVPWPVVADAPARM